MGVPERARALGGRHTRRDRRLLEGGLDPRSQGVVRRAIPRARSDRSAGGGRAWRAAAAGMGLRRLAAPTRACARATGAHAAAGAVRSDRLGPAAHAGIVRLRLRIRSLYTRGKAPIRLLRHAPA